MIQLGDTGFALCFWHEMGRMDETRRWLSCAGESDFWALASLRGVIEKRMAPTTLTRLSDEQIWKLRRT